MKAKKGGAFWILLALFSVLMLVYLFRCLDFHITKRTPFFVSDTTYIIDTFKPQPIIETKESILRTYKVDTFYVPDTFYAEIDTAAILDHFLNAYITYAKTYSDSLYTLQIQDTIHRNSIVGRNINLELYCSTTTITNTIRNNPKWSIYGGLTSYSNGIGPSLLLTKNKHAIAASYLSNGGYSLSYHFLIKSKYGKN